jgi:hypothetical protein
VIAWTVDNGAAVVAELDLQISELWLIPIILAAELRANM